MAKKKGTGKGGDDDDFDLDDIGSMEDDLNLDEFESLGDDRSPNTKAGIAKELGKEASKGFMDSLIRKTAAKSLPEEYEYNYSDAMEYADFGKEVFQTSKNRIERSMFKLGSEVKKILPFQSKMLDNFLTKYTEENAQLKQANEEAMREAGIGSELSSIFDKQLDVQKAFEARREARDEVQAKQQLATTRLSTNLLTSIDRNIAQQTAFTLQISKEYFRKSLELQYKSYFIQADMLKTMRDYYKGFSLQFESIAKNTGLPDFVKLQTSERLGELVRDKAIEGVYKKLFDNSKYVQGIKQRASNYISGKIDDKLSGVDAFSDQLEMLTSVSDNPGDIAKLLGGVFAGMGGGALGEKISDKISPKIKDKLKDNRFINAGANKLSTLANSPTTFFANLRDKVSAKKDQYSAENSMTEVIGSKLFGGLSDFLSVTTPGTMDYKVEKDSILSHNKAAIYTNKTDRSITEVIPMYLAKILKESVDLNKMYLEVNGKRIKGNYQTEELVYDYEGRGLVTGSKLVENVQKNVLANKVSTNRTASLSNSLVKQATTTLGKDKRANAKELKVLSDKDSNKILTEYISRASKLGVNKDYETLIGNATDQRKAAPELLALVEADPKLKLILESIQKTQTDSSKEFITRSISDIGAEYPVGALKRLFTDTSKLAQSKVLNVLDDKSAQTIAKAFTKYIMDSGSDVTLANTLTGRSFMYLEKKDLDALKKNLGIFTSELKKIKNNGGIVAESSLEVLFGFMNKSLRENFEVDPAVFQTLYDYSPVLGSPGKLTTENLVERRIGNFNDKQDYVDFADLKSVTRTTKAEVDSARGDILESIVNSSFGKGAAEFTKELSEAGKDPRKIFSVVTKHGKKVADNISSQSKALYKTAGDKLGDIEKIVTKITDDTARDVIGKLAVKVSELEVSLGQVIEAEKVAQREKENTLNEMKSKMVEVSNDPTTIKTLEREIKISNAYYNDKIKVLTSIRANVSNQKSRILALQESSKDKSVTDLVKEVRSILSDNLNKLKDLVEKAKEVEDRAAESVI